MKKLLILFALLIFTGCATKGINIYIIEPQSTIINKNISVIDQRENPTLLGYIYKNGEPIADITFSVNLDRYIKSRLKNISKKANIYIKKLFVSYDRSKLTGENIQGSFIAKIEYKKDNITMVKVININESRWIAPINAAKEIEKFTKKILDDGIKNIAKVLRE